MTALYGVILRKCILPILKIFSLKPIAITYKKECETSKKKRRMIHFMQKRIIIIYLIFYKNCYGLITFLFIATHDGKKLNFFVVSELHF